MSEISRIGFGGITMDTSTNMSQDGDMLVVENLHHRGGSLVPFGENELECVLDYRLVYIHKWGDFENWITYDEVGKILYCEAYRNSSGHVVKFSELLMLSYVKAGFSDLSHMGRILCIAPNGEDMVYSQFEHRKGYAPDYFLIGKIPDSPTGLVYSSSGVIDYSEVVGNSGGGYEDQVNACLSGVNMVIQKQASFCRFLFPTLFVFAYRLYDGSLVGLSDIHFWYPDYRHGAFSSADLDIPDTYEAGNRSHKAIMFYAKQSLGLLNENTIHSCGYTIGIEVEGIDPGFTGIIDGIEVFCSGYLYAYNDPYRDCFVTKQAFNFVSWNWKYSGDGIKKYIRDNPTFYHVHTFDFSSRSQSIELKGIDLNNLRTRRSITYGDCGSKDVKRYRNLFLYNSMIHAYGETIEEYGGFSRTISVSGDRSITVEESGEVVNDANTGSVTIVIRNRKSESVYVNEWVVSESINDGTEIPIGQSKSPIGVVTRPIFIHPKSGCSSVTFVYNLKNRYNGREWSRSITRAMQDSPFGDFSYCLMNDNMRLKSYFDASYSGEIPEKNIRSVYHYNTIQVSLVNNPFLYIEENNYTVGSGKIIGIGVATKELGSGQYGDFPLYVFTDEGIWALRQGSDGVIYGSAHPISREVCINKDSITSIDNGVVFSTENGVVLISGSEISNLSANLRRALMNKPDDLDFKEFINILKRCKIGYNYAMGKLYVIDPYKWGNLDVRVWVYGLRSGFWTKRSDSHGGSNSFVDCIACYPYLYVCEYSISYMHKEGEFMIPDNRWLNASREYIPGCGVYGSDYVIESRPMKLGTLGLKKILRFAIRGRFQRPCKVIVSASNMLDSGYKTIFFLDIKYDGIVRDDLFDLKGRILGCGYKYFVFRVEGIFTLGRGWIDFLEIESEGTMGGKLR